MASCTSFFNQPQHLAGWQPITHQKKQPRLHSFLTDRFNCIIRRNPTQVRNALQLKNCCCVRVTASLDIEPSPMEGGLLLGKASNSFQVAQNIYPDIIPKATEATTSHFIQRLVIADLDPATAKLAIGFLGPFLSAFGFLFILRIVMSWYPKLPVGKFPYVIAYAPTEPLLIPTRKLIPPLGGVDVTPVVWFGLLSFLNEILVGPQGLLVLLSQQVN